MRTNKFTHTSHITCLLGALGSGLILGGFVPTTYGQIIPDTTTSSVATFNNNVITLTGGVRAGNVLFHSFDQFSVDPGQTAQFANAPDLSTLITRVTGLQPSAINGVLAAQGNTDVFLLNPNGVVFGATAELDIGGSFIATTADSILFENGQQFSAVVPQSVPLLTMSTPIGLQYGTTPPNGIKVLGNGHGLTIDPITLEVVPTGPRTGLRVSAGNTLALLGGSVTLNGGSLTASEGQVALLGSGAGSTVALGESPLGWTAQQANTAPLADVTLFNAASILTSGRGGGRVQLEGQRIYLLDGSTLLADTLGTPTDHTQTDHTQTDGGVSLRAGESITLRGVALDSTTGEAIFPSSIFSEVEIGATGQGGDVQLVAPAILIADGAQVSTSVFGQGQGGNITVLGGQIELSGETPEFGSSGFFLSVADPFASGTGGDFLLQGNQLLIDEGAIIDGSTFGSGDSGDITIQANTVELRGRSGAFTPSRILSQVEGEGNGGNITIRGDVLNISAGANLSTIVFGEGDGGSINVLADSVNLKNGELGEVLSASGILSSTERESTGQGGDIRVITRQLTITDGGGIDSSTASDQRAGNVTIQAQSVDLFGRDDFPTGILSSVATGATGAGGKIDLQTESLTVQNGAQIATGTLGLGNGNDLQVTANNITLDGRNNLGRSGLFASALVDSGNGGSILVQTDVLDVQNGATINASNFPSLNSVQSPGQGAAGSIYIKANTTRIRNQGTITTSTFTGSQGNIRLESEVVLLRNNSGITTNASQEVTGGNITILSDFLVAVAVENSDVTANAQQAQGGRVNITAQGAYGFEFPDSLTPFSDVTASSDIGLNGEVKVNLLSMAPGKELGSLPQNLEDESDQVTTGCSANQGANFVATGRGGLPFDLAQQVDSLALLPAFEREAGTAFVDTLPENAIAAPPPLVEAQNWTIAPNGTVVLVAADTDETSRSPEVACLEEVTG